MEQTLNLTQEWDKVFPLSEKVNHKKVTFETQYGLTLALGGEELQACGDIHPCALPGECAGQLPAEHRAGDPERHVAVQVEGDGGGEGHVDADFTAADRARCGQVAAG